MVGITESSVITAVIKLVTLKISIQGCIFSRIFRSLRSDACKRKKTSRKGTKSGGGNDFMEGGGGKLFQYKIYTPVTIQYSKTLRSMRTRINVNK